MSDTIDATPIQAVRVQVRGPDGKAASNAVVRVQPIGVMGYYEMLVAGLSARSYDPFLADTTDQNGVMDFRVKMGPKAGIGRVLVTVPTLGLQDTARFEILPGAPAIIQSFPADQAVAIGGTITLDFHVADRYRNPRSDQVTYSGSSRAGSVEGNVMTGTAFGHAIITARAGELSLETVVQVVPTGIVAFNVRPANSGQISAIYTARLDGSDLTQVVTTAAGPGKFGWMTPVWLSSTKILYSDEVLEFPKPLNLFDLTTDKDTRFLAPAEQMEIEQQPRLSPDGKWVFFSGGTHAGYWIYRVRTNGEDLQRISPDGAELSHWTPAPSPDGSQVAYSVQGAWEGGFDVMDLGTGKVRHISVRGEHPRWSPDGTQIAYVSEDRNLRSVRPDGTGDRLLTSQVLGFSGGIDWSPDGRYVVAEANDGRLAIVEAATGEAVVVAIPGIEGILSSPVWKPEAP